MNAVALRQNREINEKILQTINIKANNSSTTKHRNQRLNMNVVLIMKYSSTLMQGKRKLCVCHTRKFSEIDTVVEK